jgi:hypothetical protein
MRSEPGVGKLDGVREMENPPKVPQPSPGHARRRRHFVGSEPYQRRCSAARGPDRIAILIQDSLN